jgi:hypothetical protein
MMSNTLPSSQGTEVRLSDQAPDAADTESRAVPLSARGQPVAQLLAVPVEAITLVARPSGVAAPVAAFVAVLVLIAVFDVEQRVVPNRIVLPAVAVVLLTVAALAVSAYLVAM